MAMRTCIFGLIVLLGATAAPCSQSVALTTHITEQDVVEGMREKGIAISLAQVKMLSTIPARGQHPLLEVVKIEGMTANASRVLLRCADHSACIPFYVVVNGLGSDTQIPAAVRDQSSFPQKSAPGALVMKKGSTATLEIVAREMLITVPVVCLQSGRQGEQVKVSLIDHSRTYQAEIVRPGLLRSRM